MTQVGEATAVSMEQELKCPMEHTNPIEIKSQPAVNKKDVEVLKSNLVKGMSTILFDDVSLSDKGLHQRLTPVPSPGVSSLVGQKLNVEIDSQILPVSVAAHHIIPGKDGLPKSKLAQYVWKSKDVIFGDIGYHVDGAENGVWLPTHQALSTAMGAGAIKSPSASNPQSLVTASYGKLSKEGSSFIEKFTQKSMDLIGAQFHDAHKEYSGRVVRLLDVISLWIKKASDTCEDCKKSKSPDGKLPPPHFLVYRINAVSRRLRGVLSGPPANWKRGGYFTSKYSQKYKAHSSG